MIIENIARAIITDSERKYLLFCSPKDKSYYYLPGGHIEFGERAVAALWRELEEEIGINQKDIRKDIRISFVGAMENFFTQEEISHHEINLFFVIKNLFSKPVEVPSRENHIVFSWLSMEELERFPILPEEIKPLCKELVESNKIAWVSK